MRGVSLISRTFCLGIIAAVLLAVSGAQGIQKASAASTWKVTGYAWNSVIGWTSQRGPVISGGSKIGSYGVEIDKVTGDISGWSWSANYGWVCWGVTCTDTAALPIATYGGTEPEPGVPASATLNLGTNEVSGWAKVVGLGLSNSGWIKLRGVTISGTPYGVDFDPATQLFNGWAWNGTNVGFPVIGWVAFSGKTLADTPGGCPVGLCDVGYDALANTSKWYTAILSRWLHTQGGNIYAKDGFTALTYPPQTPGKYNASNLIHANGLISNFSSECAGAACGDPGSVQTPITNFDAINTPKKGNKYRNTLGFLNTKALTDTTVDAVSLRNKYGYRVTEITDENDLYAVIAAGLQDRVLYYNADAHGGAPLIIGQGATSPLVIPNALSGSGAGTIIVKGDLVIRRPIVYQVGGVDSTRKTASLGWIAIEADSGIGGTVEFDDCIPTLPGLDYAAEVAGSFLAEKEIKTGTGSRTCGFNDEVPLKIDGVMVSKKFSLEREYVGNNLGSESLTNTGRMLMNTPPGLEDVPRGLPTWTSVTVQ